MLTTGLVFLQPKLDGWRVRADLHTGLVYSQSDRPGALPNIAECLRTMHAALLRTSIRYLDGEPSHTNGLHSIGGALKALDQDNHPSLNLVDCVSDEPFAQRHAHLNRLIDALGLKASSPIRLVPTEELSTAVAHNRHR